MLNSKEKKPIITAKNISKIYFLGNEEFKAVREVNLDIYEGDFTVVMGSSGSGKSTLMYLLSGLDSLSSGNVFINNQPIDHLSEKEMSNFRASEIGYVYQSINLVPDLTISENIAFPGYVLGSNKDEVKEKAGKLMESMGIKGLENRLPNQVSGGQQQRAAIARAIINNPNIVFADEPTGSLNQENGFAILDILSDINRKGQTVIMVTHDIKAACRADRIIHFKDGTIIGILELDKYQEKDRQERENRIFKFLSKGE